MSWGMFLLLMFQSFICFLWSVKLAKIDSSLTIVLDLILLKSFMMEVSFPLVLDCISLSFSAVVCFISAWVMVYSGFYMSHEIYFRRFLFLVLLFVVAMNLLIFNPSMITLMMGWDGLGVISFLLVVYYSDSNSYSAGLITVFSNRIGDVFFIILICMMCSDLTFQWFSSSFYMKSGIISVGLLVMLGSITKSAQVPFSAWLPAAMAAPTPVSTLVHSSTLVTAGVYVIIRFSYLMSESVKFFLLVVSLFTFYLASMSGLSEVDVKKVVALSTLSQVSVMMMSLGLGLKMLALFHLLVHAFFKALMFMCVGVVMFFSGGVQDIRFLSKSVYKAPIASGWFFVSVMSLCGMPFMSGFFSKDAVVEVALTSNAGWFFTLCILGSVMLTVAYSFRALFLMFKEIEISSCGYYLEDNTYLVSALSGLGVMGLFGGFFLQCLFKDNLIYADVPFIFKYFILSFLIFGGVVSYCLTSINWDVLINKKYFSSFNRFMGKMFFLPFITGNWAGSKFLNFTRWVVMVVENFWVSVVFWGVVVSKNVRSQATMSRKSFMKSVNVLIFLVVLGVTIVSGLHWMYF